MSVKSVKLKLTIAFEGTGYSGWQTQRVGLGVQQKVEEALGRLFPCHPRIHGSSRTDAGVHAVGMVAHTEVPLSQLKVSGVKLRLALNAHLPSDVRVISVTRCRQSFHAQYDAVGKQYRFFVWNHPVSHPLLRHQIWQVPVALDLNAMRTAAGHFLGTHDFRSFATTQRGNLRKETTRTLWRCDIQAKGPLLTFIIEGDGFLYRMCRGIVGTLVQVGRGRFKPATVASMLKKRDRRVGGVTAPAQGLVLWKVFYSKPVRRR